MSKALFFSDLHLDARCCGVSRFDELSETLDEIQQIAIERGCDDVIFGGDGCDPDAPELVRCIGRLANFAWQQSDSHRCTYWLTGNHDVTEDGHGTSILQPLHWIDRSIVITGPEVLRVGGKHVGFLPYPSLCNAYDPAAAIVDWARGPELSAIFGHLSITGAIPGSESKEFGRGKGHYWPEVEIAKHHPNARLLGGHYHEGKNYGSASPITVVGSPARLTFGEEHNQPRVLVIDMQTGHVDEVLLETAKKLKTVKLGAPKEEWEGAAFVRVQHGPGGIGAPLARLLDESVDGYKFEQADNEAMPGCGECAERKLVSAEDGIAIAKQLARDFQAADENLKNEIVLLTDLVADKSCST